MSNVAATNATTGTANTTPAPVSASRRRIMKEWKVMETEPPMGISAWPTSEDFMAGEATIVGPSETPYDGGVFKLSIRLPAGYPFHPPRIHFITPVWHPNIGTERGEICLDVLKDSWCPALSIPTILLSIQSLLSDPNPYDVQVPSIGNLMISNRAVADLRAQEFTHQHAMQNTQGGSSISEESQL